MDCMFSGEATENSEHIIPAWMQRKYGLSHQWHYLPNGTKIQYRFAQIPVAAEHNTIFGTIEARIAEGSASLQEYYLWALKIHIGLLFRNSNLKIDRTSPDSRTFWDLKDFSQEIFLFRNLYKVWAAGGQINPNPFGSVVIEDALTPQPAFDFIHELRSGTIFFQLDKKMILISLWDQGLGMRGNYRDILDNYHRPYIASLSPDKRQDAAYFGQRVWACERAYSLLRRRHSFSTVSSATSFSIIPSSSVPEARPPLKEEYEHFVHSFGLELMHYGGETHNQYASWNPDQPASSVTSA